MPMTVSRRAPAKDTAGELLAKARALLANVTRAARRTTDTRKATDAAEAVSQQMMHKPSAEAIEAGRAASARVGATARQIADINEANRKYWEGK